MRKIKLFAIGNQGNYNYYIFEKKQNAVRTIAKILGEIFQADIQLFKEYKDKDGNWSKRRKVNFEKRKDWHESYITNEEKRIDIFFGDKKVFATIICSQKLREKFNKELGENSYLPKDKKK
ncbi:MAG: hypothetical protein WC548_02470 [Candidatus Pacearchaeota archaeon]